MLVDNSSSMNEADRIDSIVEVARRITEIATYLVPDDEGVVLRFLNSRKTERDLYEHEDYKKIKSADVAAKMIRAADYDGCTMLGTELRNQILTPYVYEPLEKGPLPRPVLISILTDGEVNCALVYRFTIKSVWERQLTSTSQTTKMTMS